MHFPWQAQYKRHVHQRGPGANFLRRVTFWSTSFGKMILRDRCSTSYDLASLFRGKRITYFRQVEWKNRKTTYWYGAVSFEGSLAELFRF